MIVRATVVAFAGALLLSAAQAQSFNCSGRLGADERAVCDDRALADLDVQLNNTYQRAYRNATARGKQQLQDGQRQWLKLRRDCGSDRACLRDIYRDQINDLKQYD